MDYQDSTNPFYVDPQNASNRLCDPGAGCQAPCTTTATGACSCPSATACMPPGDVTGPISPAGCMGFYAQFAISPSICPGQLAMWSAASSFGNPNSTFVLGGGGQAPIVLNGASVGTTTVGFQFDFPPPVTTIPAGCGNGVVNSVTGVTCDPVNHGGVLDLTPGRYGTITVTNSATLILHPGDYMFDSLTLNPGSTLQLPADQRVRILTTTSVKLNPQVVCADASGGIVACNPDSVASNFGVMDLGTTDVLVGITMAGTIVAPNAPIRVIASNKQTVYGSFWSKQTVIVGPSGTIVVPSTNVFLDPNASAAYPACP